MAAYYNEIDPFAAQWLRNLIAAGLIAPGDVDERSITDVSPEDITNYDQCHFFAGIGAWSHALRRAKWPDDRPVWTGSCPCQPFSSAGKRAGFDDPRHLWPAWFRLIAQRRPGVIFGEQVASVAGLAWFDLVHADLEGAHYAVGAVDICAAGVGAPHIRQRLYWVADTDDAGRYRVAQPNQLAPTGLKAPPGHDIDGRRGDAWATAIPMEGADHTRRLCPPGIQLLANGPAENMGRLRAYGNAIVAPLAEQFIRGYM